jgi:hypothetical protein
MEIWLLNLPLRDYISPDQHNEDLLEHAEKHPFCLQYSSNKYYVKVCGCCEFPEDNRKCYNNRLQLYNDVKDLDITPGLVSSEILYDSNGIFLYCLVLEKYGESLNKLYLNYSCPSFGGAGFIFR